MTTYLKIPRQKEMREMEQKMGLMIRSEGRGLQGLSVVLNIEQSNGVWDYRNGALGGGCSLVVLVRYLFFFVHADLFSHSNDRQFTH